MTQLPLPANAVCPNQVRRSSRRGLLVAFTGTDGAGKSTQAGLLGRRLNQHGLQTYVSEGKDDLAPQILKRWERSGYALDNEVMGLVMAVEVVRSNARTILPLLEAGINVVAPRSIFCQLGLARAYRNPQIDRMESLLTFYGEPDLTIMIDVPLETTMDRIAARGFDDEDPELMKSFGSELRGMASERGFVMVDGNRPRERVHEDVWRACRDLLLDDAVLSTK